MHGYHVATNCLQSTASLTKFAQLLKSDCHFSYEIFVNRLRLYFHVEVVYKSPFFSLGIFLCLSFGLMMVVKYLNRKQIDTTFTHGQKIFVVLALLIKNIIYMLNNLSEINNIDFVIHLFPTFACRVKLNMILEK